MIYKKIQITWSIILIMAYSLLFYAMWTHQLSTDFYSFYASTESWVQGMKPYSLLKIPYLAGEYGANLNPPIFLMLFAPLAKLTPQDSLMVWSSLSFILNLISASIAFNLAFSKHFFKQHRLMVYLVYLSLFSTLLNTGIAQTGAWLAFLLIAGYAAYKKNHYKVAAILWGIIIAIKLFPGLLFFYILRQRHYKMAGMMAITATLLWLLPALLYGPEIYLNYFKLLSHVYWYSDNWNASLYGFLFRIFIPYPSLKHLMLTQSLYILLFLASLGWFLNKIYSIQHDEHHQQFCLTLVMMLLLSPFGWIYYFPIILLPLLIASSGTIKAGTHAIATFSCLFLLNFPVWIIHGKNMSSLFEKLVVGSIGFYGLLLLAYILTRLPEGLTFGKNVRHPERREGSPGAALCHNKEIPHSVRDDVLLFPLAILVAFGFIGGISLIWQKAYYPYIT